MAQICAASFHHIFKGHISIAGLCRRTDTMLDLMTAS